MFTLSEIKQIDRRILKSDFIRYSPSEVSTINTPNAQIFIIISREVSVITLLTSYLELNFDELQAASRNRYVDKNDIRLVNLRTIAFFSNYKLTTSSGKHLEDINHAHIVSLMYKLLTSSRGSEDFSIGIDRRRDRRQRELTNNKKIKGKYHVTTYLKDVFGFAEHRETGTSGLGYRITLFRNFDNAVLNKDNATNNGRNKKDAIEWSVPYYIPSLEDCKKKNQTRQKTATELHYPEMSAFMKEVNTHNFWTFNLGSQELINVPVCIYVVFQQSDTQHDENLNNDTFYKMPVFSCQCNTGTEKYPDTAFF